MLYCEKKLEMILRMLKSFRINDVDAVVDSYLHSGNMVKKTNIILFQLGRKIAIIESRHTEFRLGLVQIPVAPDEWNGGEIFWMCASSNMAIYAIDMTKLEVNGNLVTLQPGSSQLFSKNDFIVKYEVV